MPAVASPSLERKLPLLISVFLVALAVGLTGAGYHEVRQASELRGIERLQRLTNQLAELAGTSMQQRFAAVQRVAANKAVVAYLSAGDADPSARTAALAALRDLSLSSTDTSIVAELRSVREPVRIATRPELVGADEAIASLLASLWKGTPAAGQLYVRGDSVFFWVGAPVVGDGRMLGALVQRRTVVSNPRTEQQIRDLFGTDSVSIYVANDGGATWASLSGKPAIMPTLVRDPRSAPNVVRYARDGNRYVAAVAGIPNTPLRFVGEMPYLALLERPTAYLRRSIVVALVMLVIGIITAWILSRRITRPLRDLTVAADAITAGNYSHRAAVGRRDETGRLADAFNTMAEQVQRSHDDLAHQIAETRMLASRLGEANRAKADFLATMSHELRTPLNAIGGYVELIELGVRGPVTEAQRRDLERVRYNQRHLLTLIGTILDFTRLDAKKLPLDIACVDVGRAVHEVLAAVSPLLDEKDLRRECVGCGAPVMARADRARLEQIVLNLLSNAVRFTPAGGLITVAVSTRDEKVAVTVTDTGIGIPREKLGAIFEPFVQVDSGLTRTVGGTGLGLTISRTLARAMGGDLAADSDGASWATFTLTLPAAAQTTEEAGQDSRRLALS